jgi:hypothetical protein
MANNFGYFDESGKFADHSVISFCGLVAENQHWNPFIGEWERLLRRHHISSLHMSKGTLNFKIKFSAKKPALERAERLKVLTDFVVAIKQTLELGVIVAIDVKGFKALPSHIRQKAGDPYFLAFNRAMYETVEFLKTTSDPRIGITCDDEEKYAVECYKLFTKARRENPQLRKVLTSICFGDDQHYLQLQAADLLAYVVRSCAAQRFHGEPSECGDLFAKFLAVESDDKIQFKGGTLVGPDTLQALTIR